MTGAGPTGRVDDAALWRSVLSTLRDVIGPALPPGHEQDTVVQLQGLARYAIDRPDDPTPGRSAELARVLGLPSGTRSHEALTRASAALVAAVEDPADTAAVALARAVRPVLLAHLDADIAAAAPLLDTFAGHPATDVEPVDRVVPADEQQALMAWFADRVGGPVAVRRAVVISGGHSRRMLRVELDTPDGPLDLVVRVEQGGMFGTDGTLEASAMALLAEAGLPVAPVRWVEPSAGPLGHPFFVMEAVPGSPAVDDEVLRTFLRTLHSVHATDPQQLAAALGPPPPPAVAVRAQLAHWLGVYRAASPLPVPLLEEAAAWLRRTLRTTGPVCVVHGDPGPGNFLHVDGTITALTDWEFVHHGDAAEDWAYFATVRSRKLRSAEQWYAEIERVTGVHHDAATWHAWEAFNQMKGACANLTALSLFAAGTTTTPNLLAIGTAVHHRFVRRLAEMVPGPLDPAPATPEENL